MVKTLLIVSAFALTASSAFASEKCRLIDKDVYMGRSDKLASDTGSGKGIGDPGTTSTVSINIPTRYGCKTVFEVSDTSPKPEVQLGFGDDRNPNDNQ